MYWILAACIVILPLACYAGWLVWQVRQKQKQAQLELNRANNQRNQKVIADVRYIALSTLQDPNILSEGAIRICVLLDHITPVDKNTSKLDFRQAYPNLHLLYDKVKSLPTHQERQQLDKKDRMKMDLQRTKDEAALFEATQVELEQLKGFSPF